MQIRQLHIEKIFAIPGLGNEFTLTITNRDYTALLGVLAFYCTFIVICNLVVDLLYLPEVIVNLAV